MWSCYIYIYSFLQGLDQRVRDTVLCSFSQNEMRMVALNKSGMLPFERRFSSSSLNSPQAIRTFPLTSLRRVMKGFS